MSDLRHDPINNQWIAMAGNRRSRPMEFVPLEQVRQQIICPFCKGNESETPRTLLAIDRFGQTLDPDDESASWMIRVVSNKYPSYSTADGEGPHPPAVAPDPDGLQQVNHQPGVQELIIPSARHVASLAELTDAELHGSFKVHQHRLRSLDQHPQVKHAMLFLNCRSAAGASLGHLHWQLIGSPVVSNHIQYRIQTEQDHRGAHGCSLIHRLTDWELREQVRVVRVTENFALVCPFASRFPFQVRIVPRRDDQAFSDLPAQAIAELSQHCRDVVRWLETLLDQPAYNVALQMTTLERQREDPWYLEVFPRLTTPAGFEWGTDIWVNPVAPETAARALKSAMESVGNDEVSGDPSG